MAYLDQNGLTKLIAGLKELFFRKDRVVNNLTTAASGYALDARQGKALKALADGKAVTAAQTVVLPATGWAEQTQAVSLTGVKAANTVIAAAAPASFLAYGENGVRCVSQAAGQLTFAAEAVPEVDLAVNVLIVD